MKDIFYRPLTATPFRQDPAYQERLPKDPRLAGSIRCFWGSVQPSRRKRTDDIVQIIIPDTCVDIIYHIDHTADTVTGGFCGINDASFSSHDTAVPGHIVSTFAIRFFAWRAYGSAEDSLKGSLNGYHDISSRFQWLDRQLRPLLAEKRSLEERCAAAEGFFLKRLDQDRTNSTLDSAAALILRQKGTLSTTELARECFVSSRHLERLFHEYIGITPKKLCNLVRYQFLWNEILRGPDFHILDAVERYKYTDQSHLMREFKRYHAMDIRQARLHAYGHVRIHDT